MQLSIILNITLIHINVYKWLWAVTDTNPHCEQNMKGTTQFYSLILSILDSIINTAHTVCKIDQLTHNIRTFSTSSHKKIYLSTKVLSPCVCVCVCVSMCLYLHSCACACACVCVCVCVPRLGYSYLGG